MPELPATAAAPAPDADNTRPSAAVALAQQQQRRGNWLKTLYRWHWISSAIALFGMLLFAITGITLNHAGAIEARPSVTQRLVALPADQAELLREHGSDVDGEQPLPAATRNWLAESLALHVGSRSAEWSAEEIYLALPRPGGDAWLRIDLDAGEVEYELTHRGWIAWLNDLHKGRNTGAAWSAFIDLFAIACVLFSITGLLILKAHATGRALVWPLIGLGVVIPVLLALLFIH